MYNNLFFAQTVAPKPRGTHEGLDDPDADEHGLAEDGREGAAEDGAELGAPAGPIASLGLGEAGHVQALRGSAPWTDNKRRDFTGRFPGETGGASPWKC